MNFLSKIKKGVALLSFLALAFVTTTAFAYTDDAEIPSWADEAISELAAINVMTGNDDGSFAPNRELNRAEVSKIIVLAADVAIDTTGGAHFPDVQEGDWFYDYVETMYNYGWIDGYPDGTFKPANLINRAEIAKEVVNAFELEEIDNGPSFSDVDPADWFYPYVETVKAHGIMLGYGDGTFAPANTVTRAEAAVVVYQGLLAATEATNPAAGTLEVSLSADTPRGTNIPYNATSVPFTTLDLTASDDSDVEISAITLTRLGLGDSDDFDKVWLEIDGFKVGNDRSVNNDDIVELRFNPPIVVPAGQTLVADVVASNKYTLAADGTCYASGAEGCNIGHHNRFAVVSADDIVSTAANVVGNFPIEGEEMEVADYQVSQLTMTTLGSNTTVNVGDSFVELGKFRMLNSSTTNKDIELRAITFKNTGTAELANDLENFALYVSGEQVSAETIIDGDYVTFRLDNGVTGGYVIEDGDSRIFSMRADVVSAEANDYIEFKVDNFEDIVGIEIGTAFGVKTVDPSGNNAEDANATLAKYTIDSGDINVSRDPNSLGNQEYAPGSNDVVAMTARVVVSQPIMVDGVKIKVDSYDIDGDTAGDQHSLTTLNNYFDNFRLYLNDDLVDTENTLSGTDAAPYLDYSSQFEITGASVMKLVMNIKDEATTGSWVKFALYAKDFDSPEYISSGDTVVENDLLGSALASKVEVEESVLTITRTDSFTSEVAVAGIQDATFMKFVLDNNDSGDVNITSITIKGLGTGAAESNYSNFTASLFVDGQQIGSSKTLDNSSDASIKGTAAFNDIAVVIPSAGQEEFTVVMDTIEAVATEALANTTVVDDGTSTTNVVGGAICPAADASATNSTSPVNCTSGITADVKAGDVIEMNGDFIIVTADAGTGATAIVVDPSTVDVDHTGQDINSVSREYPVGAASSGFTVASANNISDGDTLTIGAETCVVEDVTGNTVTCKNNEGTVNNSGEFGAQVPVGTAVTEAPGGSTIRMAVTAVDADNAENGSGVKVYEAGDLLGGTDTAGPGDLTGACDGSLDTPNYLCGAEFTFTTSGTLTVSQEGIYPSTVLVENQTAEVWKLRLESKYDEIQVKDLYLTNAIGTDFDGHADFMLYNEAGQLLGTEQMTNGKVHFELNANKIIVPKDGSADVTVKIKVRNINDAARTAKQLKLELDTTMPSIPGTTSTGIEALTGATGTDVSQTSIAGAPATGDAFIAYKTKITINALPKSTQPVFTADSAGGSDKAVFRFSISTDAAGDANINRLTFSVTSSSTNVYDTSADFTDTNWSLVKFADSGYTGNPVAILDSAGAGTYDALVFDGFSDLIENTNYYELRTKDPLNTTDGVDSLSFSFVNEATAAAAYETVDATDNAGAGTDGNGDGVLDTPVTAAAPADIVWSDRSDNTGAYPFLNGYELTIPSGTLAGASEQ